MRAVRRPRWSGWSLLKYVRKRKRRRVMQVLLRGLMPAGSLEKRSEIMPMRMLIKRAFIWLFFRMFSAKNGANARMPSGGKRVLCKMSAERAKKKAMRNTLSPLFTTEIGTTGAGRPRTPKADIFLCGFYLCGNCLCQFHADAIIVFRSDTLGSQCNTFFALL